MRCKCAMPERSHHKCAMHERSHHHRRLPHISPCLVLSGPTTRLSKPLALRFRRAIADFNETRASDIFVINFGAHYHETPEGDQQFKDAVFPILDEMAEVGKTATVVWRYSKGGLELR